QEPHTLPNLHSFPTRRSSDLVESVLRNHAAPTAYRSSPKRFSGRRASATRPVAMNDHPTINEKAMKPWLTVSLRAIATAEAAPRDRKSTRLNSSHEWISYAVF